MNTANTARNGVIGDDTRVLATDVFLLVGAAFAVRALLVVFLVDFFTAGFFVVGFLVVLFVAMIISPHPLVFTNC